MILEWDTRGSIVVPWWGYFLASCDALGPCLLPGSSSNPTIESSFVQIWDFLLCHSVVARRGYISWAHMGHNDVKPRSSSHPSTILSSYPLIPNKPVQTTDLTQEFQMLPVPEPLYPVMCPSPHVPCHVPHILSCAAKLRVPNWKSQNWEFQNWESQAEPSYPVMCRKIAELQSAKLLPRPSLVGPLTSQHNVVVAINSALSRKTFVT